LGGAFYYSKILEFVGLKIVFLYRLFIKRGIFDPTRSSDELFRYFTVPRQIFQSDICEYAVHCVGNVTEGKPYTFSRFFVMAILISIIHVP
jgi:hypothetical protein